MSWQPTASLANLRIRAEVIAKVRHFFAAKHVLEVDTPLLSHATVTDPHVVGIPAFYAEIGSAVTTPMFLQTSPEYAMKRLLAAGSGSIFQICKAFRQGERGERHNPEFTILEWYRLGFDHHALMDEVDALLQTILQTPAAHRMPYATLFESYLAINPHSCCIADLKKIAAHHAIADVAGLVTMDAWLDLLWTHCIESKIGGEQPLFVYDFPVTQAALAKIRKEDPPVASRFEVYYQGVELANGFHELQDASEQKTRFLQDQAFRLAHQLPEKNSDPRLLAALEHGLPDCAGVALGIDRLVMLVTQAKNIGEVISFTIDNA